MHIHTHTLLRGQHRRRGGAVAGGELRGQHLNWAAAHWIDCSCCKETSNYYRKPLRHMIGWALYSPPRSGHGDTVRGVGGRGVTETTDNMFPAPKGRNGRHYQSAPAPQRCARHDPAGCLKWN